jgi:hypothetical protein
LCHLLCHQVLVCSDTTLGRPVVEM